MTVRTLSIIYWMFFGTIALVAVFLVTAGCLHPHQRCTKVDSYGYHQRVCEWETKR